GFEEQAAAVRAPTRVRVALPGTRQRPWRELPFRRRDPDGRKHLVRVHIDRTNRVSDLLSIRADLRIREALELKHVVERQGPLRFGGSDLRRGERQRHENETNRREGKEDRVHGEIPLESGWVRFVEVLYDGRD